MKLSIVTTLYKSELHISEFYERISQAAKVVAGDDYEIILVNDGSPDDSLKLVISIAKTDTRIVVIDLSRNFGHHKAMMTGLMHSQGNLIFLIDSDLEEDPAYLVSFFNQIYVDSCDVVYGVQENRKGGWFERWSGNIFWKIIGILSASIIPSNIATIRIMTRRYVNALVQHTEREVFMAGLLSITGFDQRPKIIIKKDTSNTTYTLCLKLKLLINSITSFSNTPLISIFYFGMLILFGAIAYIIFIIYNYFFNATTLVGFTSLMASIWLLGGFIISFLGVIGIYLAKVFSEVKQRPYTIVRDIYQSKVLK